MEPVTRRALLPLAAALLLASASAVSAEPDAAERKFIRQGMGEGEVVLKIGPPDHEAVHRAVRGQPGYTPAVVKQTVAGYGRGEKSQVAEMVRLQLSMKATPAPVDAADALAVAITHWAHSRLAART